MQNVDSDAKQTVFFKKQFVKNQIHKHFANCCFPVDWVYQNTFQQNVNMLASGDLISAFQSNAGL